MAVIPSDIGTTDAAAAPPLPSRPLSVPEARERLRRSDRVLVHCDGGCEPNPGVGGFGVVIDCHQVGRVEIIGGEPVTTNNRMELMAVITALTVLPANCQVTIVSDSEYVVKGSTEWAASRQKKIRKWTDKQKAIRKDAPVPNADLWVHLDGEAAGLRVTWRWVRGHNGHAGNERADALATQGMMAIRRATP